MGNCASVGVTGLTLNGGQGLLSRLHGMTCDLLSSIELVDHQGRQINASASNEYADYFWLARGGGAAVQHYPGIVIGLEFSTLLRITPNSTSWTRVKIEFTPTIDNAVQLLLAWQEFHMKGDHVANPLFRRVELRGK